MWRRCGRVHGFSSEGEVSVTSARIGPTSVRETCSHSSSMLPSFKRTPRFTSFAYPLDREPSMSGVQLYVGAEERRWSHKCDRDLHGQGREPNFSVPTMTMTEMNHAALTSSLLAHMRPYSFTSRLEGLVLLQQWVQRNIGAWNAHLRARWQLDEVVELDLSALPVDGTFVELVSGIERLESVPPSSMEVLAMMIRDIWWEAVTLESSTICPRCGEVPLRILEWETSGTIVLSCDLCAWSQSAEGAVRHGPERARPPARDRIARWRAGVDEG